MNGDFRTERGTLMTNVSRLLISICIVFGIAGLMPVTAQEPALPPQALERVKNFFEARRSSRYMEQDCHATTYPGWEGLPLQECTYKVKGDLDSAWKTAKVIMLNAAPDQLARWIVRTCIEVTGGAARRC